MANFADTFTGTGFLDSLSGSQVSGGALENMQPNYWTSPLDAENDGYITLGSISSTDPLSCAGHPITISAWVRKDSTSSVNNYQRVFDKANGANSDGGYGLYIDKSLGRVYVGCSGHVSYTDSSVFLYNGKWQHILATVDGTNFRQYVNGEFSTNNNDTALPPATTAGAAIGAMPYGITNEYEGDIARVFIYSGVMSDYDICQTYMTATIPSNKSGLNLVQGWNLDSPLGGAGTRTYPYIGITQTGQLVGSDSDIVSGSGQTIGAAQTTSSGLGDVLTGDGTGVSGANAITGFSGVWRAKPGNARAAVQFSPDGVVWKSSTGTPVPSGAFYFDGVNDTISTTGVFDAKTISFWVYSMHEIMGGTPGHDDGHLQAWDNKGIISTNDSNGTDAMDIGSDGSGIVRFNKNGSPVAAHVYVDGIKAIPSGAANTPDFQSRLLYRKWQHVAVVKPDGWVSSGMHFGYGFKNTTYWNGALADVRVYDTELTEAEVEQLYINHDAPTGGLVSHYPFTRVNWNNLHCCANDVVGGHDGTVSGAMNFTDFSRLPSVGDFIGNTGAWGLNGIGDAIRFTGFEGGSAAEKVKTLALWIGPSNEIWSDSSSTTIAQLHKFAGGGASSSSSASSTSSS